MRYLVERMEDLIAGLVTALIGVFIIFEASGYKLGTLRSMGPGYFPRILGLAMVGFGALIASPLSAPVGQRPQETAGWTSLILLASSFVAFALLVESAGLIPATFGAVLLAALADIKMRRKPVYALALAAATAVACYLIFGLALGLQMSAFAL